MDFVTVNQSTSLPVIHWSVNNSSLINGYAVKRFIRSYPSVPDNTWHTVQRIENSNIFTFEDNSVTYGQANPNGQPEIYEVTAYKINGSDTVFSLPSEKHKTIYVSGDYDYCSNSISIKWNNYVGWGSNFVKYIIYCKENNGNYIKLSEKVYNDTTFVHKNLQYNSTYTYYIKAVRNDGTESFSNLKSINTDAVNFPTILTIDSVQVDNAELTISFSFDSGADVESYSLFKSPDYDSGYLEIDNLSGINFIPKFSDKNFNPEKISYYYIAAVDYCGNILLKSDTVSNIVLSVSAVSENKTNILHWKDMYSGLPYQVFRSADNSIYELISENNNHVYNDNVKPLYENQFISETTSGKFCYYVQINENNFFNKSNTGCVEQDETVIFPNAFNPRSRIEENRTFKPKSAFISDYQLTIYGSFGDILFESKNPDYGWNGMLKNGKLAPISSYLYIVKYKNSKGRYIKLKNYVTLVY